MAAKKKPAPVVRAHDGAEAPSATSRRGKPKSKKPKPISENPAAGLALLHRARRGR